MRDAAFSASFSTSSPGAEGRGLIGGYLNDASRHALEEQVAHEDMAREYIEERT